MNHPDGVARDEAEAFVEDHGIARAVVWLRACKGCRGEGSCLVEEQNKAGAARALEKL